MSEIVGNQSLQILQGVTQQAEEEELKQSNRILVKHSRRLASLQDQSNKKNFKVTSYEDQYKRKILKYTFEYKLPIVGILKEFFRDHIDQPKEYDVFWMNVYCVKGLTDIEQVSEEIARLFCPFVTSLEIIGKLRDMKIVFTEYLMNIYTTTFKELANKYNIDGTMWFTFDIESIKSLTEEDLMEKLNLRFQETFAQVQKEIRTDVQQFISNVEGKLSKLIELKTKNNQIQNINSDIIKIYFSKSIGKLTPEQISGFVSSVNNNRFSVKNTEEYDYWVQYINYLKKNNTNHFEKNKYYFKNMKEQLMISCLDVLSVMNVDYLNQGKKFTNKCIELGEMVVNMLPQKLWSNDNDNLGHLLFASSFWETLKNKIKLVMVEQYDEKNNYYDFNPKEFAQIFEVQIKTFVDVEKDKFFKLNDLINLQFSSKQNFIGLDYEKKKEMLNSWEVRIFLNKYYDYILVEPSLSLNILDGIEKFGGASKILNNMDIYLKFHPFVRDIFQKLIKKDKSKIDGFYREKFIDKILFHFHQRYQKKKDFMKDIIKESFDSDIVNYQDFFYFYEVVLDEMQKTFDLFDWENSDLLETKPLLYNKLKKTMHKLGEDIQNLVELAEKTLQITPENKFKFKSLIMSVLSKNNNPDKYQKTELIDPQVSNKEDKLVKDLIEQYNKDHTDNIVKIQEQQTEIILKDQNIFNKLLNLQTQNGNEQLNHEVAKNIKILIDNHDTLPIELRNLFVQCKSVENEKIDEKDCDSQRNQEANSNISGCFRANPALVIESCVQQKSIYLRHGCEEICPENFTSDKNGLCKKPDVYYTQNKKCQINFEFVEGFCFPKCPKGWRDEGKYCQKPKNKQLKKFYHRDFLTLSIKNQDN